MFYYGWGQIICHNPCFSIVRLINESRLTCMYYIYSIGSFTHNHDYCSFVLILQALQLYSQAHWNIWLSKNAQDNYWGLEPSVCHWGHLHPRDISSRVHLSGLWYIQTTSCLGNDWFILVNNNRHTDVLKHFWLYENVVVWNVLII